MVSKPFPVIDLVATGKNITRLREESGYSIADLQGYFGFTGPQAIYKWQEGKSLPSTDNLIALSYLLEKSMEEILVTRQTALDIMPQDKTCGDPFFVHSSLKSDPHRIPSVLRFAAIPSDCFPLATGNAG